MKQRYPWLVGQFDKIRQDAEAGRLAHALLITGPVGAGIIEFASEVANYRLCQSPVQAACGNCKACQLLRAGSHPDLRILEPEGASQSIRVDQIRSLVDFVAQTPQIGDWKLVVIQSAHRMNQNAANALLKMLEEPAGNCLILLATERPQMLLPTVRSRCSQIRLRGPSVNQSVEFLTGQGMAQKEAAQLVDMVGVRPLQIQAWAEQEILPQWKSAMEKFQQLDKGTITALEAANALSRLDLGMLLVWAMEFVAGRSRVLAVSDRSGSRAYLALYHYLQECRKELDAGTNPNAQLALETLFLEWQQVARLQ